MVYRKGERSKAQLLRQYQHRVVIRIPPDGLDRKLFEIQAELVRLAPAGHAHWSELRGLDHWLVCGFEAADHAEAFRRFVAERWPGLLDAKPMSAPKVEPWGVKRAP